MMAMMMKIIATVAKLKRSDFKAYNLTCTKFYLG